MVYIATTSTDAYGNITTTDAAGFTTVTDPTGRIFSVTEPPVYSQYGDLFMGAITIYLTAPPIKEIVPPKDTKTTP